MEPPPAVRSLPRDVLIGTALGLALAVLWVVVLLVSHPPRRMLYNFGTRLVEYGDVGDTSYSAPVSDFTRKNLGLGCLVLLTFAASIAGGVALGVWSGWRPGAVVGAGLGYVAPFVGLGVYVQRTVGWAKFIGYGSPGNLG